MAKYGNVQQRVAGALSGCSFWINTALRSVIWLGGAVGLACLKKADRASL